MKTVDRWGGKGVNLKCFIIGKPFPSLHIHPLTPISPLILILIFFLIFNFKINLSLKQQNI